MIDEINLRSDWLSDEAMLSLSKTLRVNRRLKRLDISDNTDISSVGWEAFAAALNHSGLEVLNVSCNGVNDRAVRSLSNALMRNNRLLDLDISGNRGATPLAWEIFPVLLASPMSALQRLNLDRNRLHDGMMLRLQTSWKTILC